MNKKILQQDVSSHPSAEQVRWHGDYFSMLCPFEHVGGVFESNPSLLVYGNGWHCQSANHPLPPGGTLRRLWDVLEGREAAVHEGPALVIRWSEIAPGGAPRMAWIEAAWEAARFPDVAAWYHRRGFGMTEIDKYLLGYWRGWYVTPVFDERRVPLRVVLRAGPTIERSVNHRYLCSPGPACLFVPDWGLLRTRPKNLTVVFGIYDALTLAVLRVPAATGTTGTNLPPELLDPFRRTIYVAPDKGEEVAARKLVRDLGWRGKLNTLKYPPGLKDPNDFLAHRMMSKLIVQLGGCYA